MNNEKYLNKKIEDTQSKEGIKFNAIKLLSPFVLLRDGLNLYKQKFSVLFKVVLVYVIFSVLINYVAIYLNISQQGAGDTMFQLSTENITRFILALVLGLVFWLVSLWHQIAILYIIIEDKLENKSVWDVYKANINKVLPYLLIIVLMLYMYIGGVSFFVIPGIIFVGWFSLTQFVFIEEGKRGMNALLRSKDYIQGLWWQAMLRYVFVFLFLFLVSVLFGMIFAFIPEFLYDTFANIVLSFVFSPIVAIYMYLIYRDIKDKKDGIVSDYSTKRKAKFLLISLVGILIALSLIFLANNSL